jgi:hypothetical protein
VEALRRQHAGLKTKAGQRQKDIAESQKGLNKLTDGLNAVQKAIGQAAATVDAMGPIAGDVGAIKKLQDQLKVCTGGWGVCV